MTEYEEAKLYANKILDRVNADPDDDQAVVARQFLRATERLDWRLIDTAPKDGTQILAFGRRDKKSVYAVTWWRLPKDAAGYIGWGEFNEHFWPATHWVPLQPAPRSHKENDEAKNG